jgi:hypothetical protein
MNKEKSHQKWPMITAFVSIIVGLSALFVSISEVRQIQHHDKLSVKPLLVRDCIADRTSNYIGILLSNNGLGPAKIEKLIVTYNKKRYHINNLSSWSPLLRYMNLNRKWVSIRSMGGEYWIKPNEMKYIIWADQKKINQDQRQAFVDFIRKLKLDITYSSIYGEKFHRTQTH